jgi:hypothetical protein
LDGVNSGDKKPKLISTGADEIVTDTIEIPRLETIIETAEVETVQQAVPKIEGIKKMEMKKLNKGMVAKGIKRKKRKIVGDDDGLVEGV